MEKSCLFPDVLWARWCLGLCKQRLSSCSISLLSCGEVLSIPVGTMEAEEMLCTQHPGL